MSGTGESTFRVLHTTKYVYSEPVSASLHQAVLIPRQTGIQRVESSSIRVEPEPRNLATQTDYFGNNLTRFSLEKKQKGLRVDAESLVVLRHEPLHETSASPPLAELRRKVHEASTPDALRALEFVFGSRYIPPSKPLASYAAPSFVDDGPVLDGVLQLMHRIHDDFTYDPSITEISTPVEEVLARRGGVCQDFAHVMIGCLRSLDIPARYVSGYLVPAPGVVGAQASHAWISVYSPGAGWIDFDPTNDILPSGGHVTIGWGRDYSDVSPLRGVVLGGGSHTVTVEVKVRPSVD